MHVTCGLSFLCYFFFLFFTKTPLDFLKDVSCFQIGLFAAGRRSLQIWECIEFLLLKLISLNCSNDSFHFCWAWCASVPSTHSHKHTFRVLIRLCQLPPLPLHFEDVQPLMSLGPCDIFSGVEKVGCRAWRCITDDKK